jgi:hypothetical protein
LLGLIAAAPAVAIGLGPLKKEGSTPSEAKAFYLTVINNGPTADVYRATAIGFADEVPQARVQIIPSVIPIGPNSTRRILVIARDLAPGETYAFRVCADSKPQPKESIHARVCSKLSTRRLSYRP